WLAPKRLPKSFLRSPNATARGVLGHVENFADLGARQALPVIQLDDDLQVERNRAKRLEQARMVLLLRQDTGRARAQVGDRHFVEVDALPTPSASTVVLTQNVVRDREQKRAKRGTPCETFARLDAARERRLNEILCLDADLVHEEAPYG